MDFSRRHFSHLKFPCTPRAITAAQALFALSCVIVTATGCGYVHHVPPGQSVAFSMAKKADLVAMPPSPQPTLATAGSRTAAAQENIEPQMPSASDTEKVADSFALGNLFMEQGRYTEAIAAYEAAVKIDPTFADAWNKLAVAYQNSGQDQKALEAYRRFKSALLQ